MHALQHLQAQRVHTTEATSNPCADASSTDVARADIAAMLQQGIMSGLHRVFRNMGAALCWLDTSALHRHPPAQWVCFWLRAAIEVVSGVFEERTTGLAGLPEHLFPPGEAAEGWRVGVRRHDPASDREGFRYGIIVGGDDEQGILQACLPPSCCPLARVWRAELGLVQPV